MSLSTYGGIKTAIASYLGGRTDLTSQIVDAVTLAETRIHYGTDHEVMPSKPLRIRAMETREDITINAEYVSLPTGYLGARRFHIDGYAPSLDYVTPEQASDWYVSTATGRPGWFTLEGDYFRFKPVPDSTYTGKLLYYKKFTAFAADGDSNWLTANAPGAYLYGALIEMMPYTRNDPRMNLWYSTFVGLINGLNNADRSDRFSGSALIMQPSTFGV